MGTSARSNELVVTSAMASTARPGPNETFSCCDGYGLNDWSAVNPSGATRARYSPSFESWKLVCSSFVALARSLPEANTILNPPAGTTTPAGNRHFAGKPGSSVR